MNKKELLCLISKMSLTEKAMQMTQLAAGLICHTQLANLTGPFREWSFTDEELEWTGSVLGANGAEYLMKIQKEYLEKSEKKIPLMFMEDVIHGFSTIFPIPLAQSCSFRPELVEEAAYATAKEASAAGVHVTFSPMADLVRDPRWGRVMEAPGEDPYLAGVIAAAMVRGYQGDDISAKDRMAACVKHFAGYGQPEGGREYNTVDMSKGVLREFYLPAYKKAIEAGAALVMASFNTIERVPATCSTYLLRKILREDWKFDGVVISDYSAMDEIMNHSVAADAYEAGEKCIKAGMDIEMMSGVYEQSLQKLIDEESITMEEVDECVLRILELKNKLGLFENPYKGANPELEKKLCCCEEHRDVARRLAAESMVLLKNEGVLPLTENQTIGLAGPMAATGNILGGWHCVGKMEDAVTLENGMRAVLGERLVTSMTTPFERGVKDISDEAALAADTLKDCEVCVVAVGEPEWETGEAASKTCLRLSPNQEKLIHTLKAAGKKVVTLLFTGRPMDIASVAEVSDAVLQVWFPGTEGGNAAADILFGKVNPSARQSMSFPRNVGQIPVYYNCYNTGRPKVREEDWYTSKYLDCPNEPLYPFGYGLSYTSFGYSGLEVNTNEAPRKDGTKAHCLEKGTVKASVVVKNEGTRAGETVVQLYIRDVSGSVVRPLKELKGFQKIMLEPGEERKIEFAVTKEMLSFYNNEEEFVFEKGFFDIMLGEHSGDVLTERIWIS